MSEPRSRWLYVLGIVILSTVALVLIASLVMRLLAPPAIPVVALSGEEDGIEVINEYVTVQVVNAAGIPGAARAVREHLIDRGFDVVESGTRRPADIEETQVISRTESPIEARWVARALGLPLERVIEEPRPELYVHVTVMIGRDYLESTNVGPE